MRHPLLILISCVLIPVSDPASAKEPETPLDPCSLLTRDEIKAVIGNEVKETKTQREEVEGFVISQCVFAMPKVTDSFTLKLVQRGTGKAQHLT